MTATLDLERVQPTRPSLAGRLTRCMSVSVITTVISLSTIIVATAVFGIAAAVANVIATSIATVPSYSLNRRWTWGRRDRSDPWREVFPFWVLAFCGLALSTVTVGIADSWASTVHLSPLVHTATILVGHLGGFGVLWVLQFVLLDRVLFAQRTRDSTGGDAPDPAGARVCRTSATRPPAVDGQRSGDEGCSSSQERILQSVADG